VEALETHFDYMDEILKETIATKVIETMKTMYHVAINNMPLDSFESERKYSMFMKDPQFNCDDPKEYGKYLNRTSSMEFLSSIRDVYFDVLLVEIKSSPFY